MANVETLFRETLSALPWPATQPPGLSDYTTYLVFNLAGETAIQPASNRPQRLRYLVQLHAYSTDQDGEHRRAFDQAVKLLREKGVRIYQIGPDDYEKDTGRHHIAATCEWVERIEVGPQAE